MNQKGVNTFFIIFGLFAVFLLVFGFYYFQGLNFSTANTNTIIATPNVVKGSPAPNNNLVTIKGEFVCLPQPDGREICEYGFYSEDEQYYGVISDNPDFFQVGKKGSITGIIKQAQQGSKNKSGIIQIVSVNIL